MTEELASRLQLAVALLAAVLLGLGVWLERTGRREAFGRLRDRLLMAVGIIGAAAYINFGAFHFFNFIHNWDTFHYFIGAKYFPELGYDRLYACTAVAESEAGVTESLKKRVITELKTNTRISASQVLEHPAACRDRFSAER